MKENLFIDRKQQIKNSAIYLLPNVVRAILPFVGLCIFTRILTKEDYGVLALAKAFAVCVSALANLSMIAAYNRNYFQYRHDLIKSAQLLYSVITFVAVNFIISCIITYLFMGDFSKFLTGSEMHGTVVLWALIVEFLLSINQYYFGYLRNAEIAKDFVYYTISGSVITFITSLFLVAYRHTGVIGIVYSQACSGAIVFCILGYKISKTLKPNLSKAIFSEALRLAYPLTPKILVSVVGKQMDKYLISLLASLGGSGIYSIGMGIANSVFTFLTALQNVFVPRVYSAMFDLGEDGPGVIGRYLTPFIFISVTLALLVSMLSEEAISILTPPSYHAAIDVTAILSIYFGILFFGTIPQLVYKKKMAIISVLSILRLGVNVAFNIPLILKWGTMGAAWGMLLTGFVLEPVCFCLSQHYYPIKWQYKEIAFIYFAFIVFSILVYGMRIINIPYTFVLAAKMIAIAVFGLIGMKVDVITGENYRLVKDMTAKLIAKTVTALPGQLKRI